MNIYLYTLYKKLSTPEKNGKKIGFFRIITAIFGGFILAILSMTLLVYIISRNVEEGITIPVLLSTFVWALLTLWISLSANKISALLRFILPSVIIGIVLLTIYVLR